MSSGCFACTWGKAGEKEPVQQSIEKLKSNGTLDIDNGEIIIRKRRGGEPQQIVAQKFSYHQLSAATKHFTIDYLLGEGGFGRVYKGKLKNSSQIVAIKQLNPHSSQGNKEFLVEVVMLSLLHHPNLVTLIGYCAEGNKRLLVYDYMPLGSLDKHLFDLSPNKMTLDWNTRLKVACGAAKGLEHLHDRARPPIIYRDLKCSNILLDEGYHARLSDFGLAKLGPVGDSSHVSTRVMGTYGYCAPEYVKTGHLTLKSDIYSFGVVLLELITGRRAFDTSRALAEQDLIAWVRPLLKDRRRFQQIADPMLQDQYPPKSLYQALGVAAMCVHEQAAMRPSIADIVTALSYIYSQSSDSKNQHTAETTGLTAPKSPRWRRESM